jgi:hypothetical protein
MSICKQGAIPLVAYNLSKAVRIKRNLVRLSIAFEWASAAALCTLGSALFVFTRAFFFSFLVVFMRLSLIQGSLESILPFLKYCTTIG